MRAFLGIDGGSVYFKSTLFIPKLVDPAEFNFRGVRHSHVSDRGTFYFLACKKGLSAPLEAISRHIEEVEETLLPHGVHLQLGTTGRMGKAISSDRKSFYMNDFACIARGVGEFFPSGRTIFEIGGETSRFISLKDDEKGRLILSEYGTNGECAAGTGSFIDQQAGRMNVPVEMIGELLKGVTHPARIAGRCSVFAKSDMIHAQQKGATPGAILKGLMFAVARNFKSNVCKGRELESDILFLGGVAANRGIVEALEEVFSLPPGQIKVPPFFRYYPSAGVALLYSESAFPEVTGIEIIGGSSRRQGNIPLQARSPLSLENVIYLKDSLPGTGISAAERQAEDLFLGIDIGSVSTNFAVIDTEGNVIDEVYVRTEGRPVDVVMKNLKEIGERLGEQVKIRGAGTTGSGRELVGELIGADVVIDEITAHKSGATFVANRSFNSEVDTIFEIGGQDSKFISIREGIVVDFAMNDACAAGTGSFLEEQAEKIGISIKSDFSRIAFSSSSPLRLGERCTVFMEQDVSSYLNRGFPVEDIVGGLAYGVVLNYLNRVVRGRRIGDRIYFQGGTAYNPSVAAAFSAVLEKTIIVPPHNGVIGAIGSALVAMEKYRALKETTRFRGFDLSGIPLRKRDFLCRGCSNECDVKEIEIEGEKTYWGDKCSEKFRKPPRVPRKPSGEDLVAMKVALFEDLLAASEEGGRLKVGIPRSMYFFERFPFWNGFFSALDISIRATEPTSRGVAEEGIEMSVSEPCHPILVSMGHVSRLVHEMDDVDFYFIPNVINSEHIKGSSETYYCPWGQTLPFMVSSNPHLSSKLGSKLISPTVYFRDGERLVSRDLYESFKRFGYKKREVRRAVKEGYEASRVFGEKISRAGQRVLEGIEKAGTKAVLLLGRPYNIYDREMNLNIPSKIREFYGLDVVPYDFLSKLGEIHIDDLNWNMFWNLGRKIISAARWAESRKNFSIVYFTNFKCGPDSFLRHYVEEASGRPFLTLQFDGHGNDAGYLTRVEAYLDSKGVMRWWNGYGRCAI